MTPIVREHDGIFVVRDDLFHGGSKARFIPTLFDGVEELVYASPAEGGAQTALAQCAAALGKRCTIFVAKRQQPHPRSLMAKRLGAKVIQVAPGYLTVVQKRAKQYAQDRGVDLAPFGLDVPIAGPCLAAAARAIDLAPDEVWCAGGSGVLARALRAAWPSARHHVVQVGRSLDGQLPAGMVVHVHPLAFGDRCRQGAPFDSDAHYDAKAWEICARDHGTGRVIFWNVTGEAQQ